MYYVHLQRRKNGQLVDDDESHADSAEEELEGEDEEEKKKLDVTKKKEQEAPAPAGTQAIKPARKPASSKGTAKKPDTTDTQPASEAVEGM